MLHACYLIRTNQVKLKSRSAEFIDYICFYLHKFYLYHKQKFSTSYIRERVDIHWIWRKAKLDQILSIVNRGKSTTAIFSLRSNLFSQLYKNLVRSLQQYSIFPYKYIFQVRCARFSKSRLKWRKFWLDKQGLSNILAYLPTMKHIFEAWKTHTNTLTTMTTE